MLFDHITDEQTASGLGHRTLIELSLVRSEKVTKRAETKQINSILVAHSKI